MKEKSQKNSQIKGVILISSIIALILLVGIALILSNMPISEPLAVEPQVIKATLKEGEKIDQKITVTNLLKKDLVVYPKINGIQGNIPNSITLQKYGKGDVNLLGFVSPGAYGTFVGNIEFLTEKYGKSTALIIIDSETKTIDFDATIEPLISQAQNIPGNMATFLVNLYNIRNSDSRDLLLEYSLITASGNIIMVESEKLLANTGEWTKASVSKSIRIPENAAPGKYILSLKLTSKESTAAASTFFEVGKTLDPAFASLCPAKGISCSLLLVILILIAFFIGGYSYYYLARTIFRRIKEKESKKNNVEIIILVLLAIITLFILYQLITKTGVLQGVIGGSSEIIKIIVIMAVIIALLEIIYKKNKVISSKIRGIINSAQVKRISAKSEENEYACIARIHALEMHIDAKKLEQLKSIEEEKRLEHELWLEKKRQFGCGKNDGHERKAESSGKIWRFIIGIFTKKRAREFKGEDPIERIERLRKRSERKMEKEESSIKRDIFKK